MTQACLAGPCGVHDVEVECMVPNQGALQGPGGSYTVGSGGQHVDPPPARTCLVQVDSAYYILILPSMWISPLPEHAWCRSPRVSRAPDPRCPRHGCLVPSSGRTHGPSLECAFHWVQVDDSKIAQLKGQSIEAAVCAGLLRSSLAWPPGLACLTGLASSVLLCQRSAGRGDA